MALSRLMLIYSSTGEKKKDKSLRSHSTDNITNTSMIHQQPGLAPQCWTLAKRE